MRDHSIPDMYNIHVNLTNNKSSSIKNFGLNPNKRGKLKDGDVSKFSNDGLNNLIAY